MIMYSATALIILCFYLAAKILFGTNEVRQIMYNKKLSGQTIALNVKIRINDFICLHLTTVFSLHTSYCNFRYYKSTINYIQ